jgi:hypothetical protein
MVKESKSEIERYDETQQMDDSSRAGLPATLAQSARLHIRRVV